MAETSSGARQARRDAIDEADEGVRRGVAPELGEALERLANLGHGSLWWGHRSCSQSILLLIHAEEIPARSRILALVETEDERPPPRLSGPAFTLPRRFGKRLRILRIEIGPRTRRRFSWFVRHGAQEASHHDFILEPRSEAVTASGAFGESS